MVVSEEVNFQCCYSMTKLIVSGYAQEITQSQNAVKPVASRGRATQQSRDTRKTKLAKQPAHSFSHQDDCKSRMDKK